MQRTTRIRAPANSTSRNKSNPELAKESPRGRQVRRDRYVVMTMMMRPHRHHRWSSQTSCASDTARPDSALSESDEDRAKSSRTLAFTASGAQACPRTSPSKVVIVPKTPSGRASALPQTRARPRRHACIDVASEDRIETTRVPPRPGRYRRARGAGVTCGVGDVDRWRRD